jgi:glucose-1-phosphate thymidylyltransferase
MNKKGIKGIILAGGTGSRLHPLTKVTNKALLPVGRYPLIYHLLNLYKAASITNIMVVTNTEHVGHVISLLGSGEDMGVDLTYKVQDKPNGIAAALGLCRDFIKDEKFAVLLGDNIFSDQEEIAQEIRKFDASGEDYKLFLKEVTNPERFGVPVFDSTGKIIDIMEKPNNPPNNMAIVGLYLYTNKIFQVIDGLSPSSRGEYEISDLNAHLAKNESGSYYNFQCDWFDAGNFDSYFKANMVMKDKQ